MNGSCVYKVTSMREACVSLVTRRLPAPGVFERNFGWKRVQRGSRVTVDHSQLTRKKQLKLVEG